jgi:plasmid stabilization system protein ParE
MIYAISFTPKAANDLRQIRAWYSKESDLLAERFFESLDAALNQISKNPHRFMFLQEDVRRALMKRFPYKIVFTTNEAMNRVYIIAVIHNARHPRVWKRRV